MKKVKKYKRPSWDEYFIQIMLMVGSRGTCDRGRSGCLVVRDKRILTTGYVGSPIGMPHCDELGHEMQDVIHENGVKSKHCVRTIHAEQNAIAQAARIGTALDGGTIYVRMTPCYTCAKMLVNAGIKRVVALEDYHAATKSKQLFKKTGVVFKLLRGKIVAYDNQ